ncbi:MAG: methionine synthase [Syntrophaceae bacterium]
MPAVSIFEQINVPLPKQRIYRRLGYRQGVTGLTPDDRNRLEYAMDEALAHIHLKGAAGRLAVRDKNSNGVTLANGVELAGKKLAALLKGSEEVLLMAATGGPEIMEAIAGLSSAGNLSRAVVFDAVASEVVDSALDWIAKYYDNSLRREGRHLTSRRFSAGYGDFVLENQKFFFRELELEKIGVELTASCILVPEKSVTAIAGIEKAVSQKTR